MPLPADADGGVEEHRVDAFGVHDAEPLDGIVAAGRATLGVGHPPTGEQLGRVHLDAAEGAHLAAQGLERLAIDEQHLVPLRVGGDANGAVPIGGLEVFQPRVGRLEDVAVRIHHQNTVRGRHGLALRRANARYARP